eukprot:6634798-Prymnesium_polylepis.1
MPAVASSPRADEQTDWDGSPLTRKSWYLSLPKRIAQSDSAYRALWERGITLTRNVVYCMTPEHAYQISIKNLTKGTFKTPFDVTHLKLINPALTLAARRAVVNAAFAADPDTAETEYDKTKYQVAEEQTEKLSNALCDDILATIANEQQCEDLRTECNNDGLSLLTSLALTDSQTTSKLATRASTDLADLLAKGLAGPY